MNTEEYQTRYGTDPDYIDSDGYVYDDVDLIGLYDAMLNESCPVTIGGHEYDPAEILKAVDPTAYRVGMADYVSALDWDEWTADHEWNTTDEDAPECEDCGTEVTSDEVTVSLARHARIMCEGCGNFEV